MGTTDLRDRVTKILSLCDDVWFRGCHHLLRHSLVNEPLLPGKDGFVHTLEQIRVFRVVRMWIVCFGLLDSLAMSVYSYRTDFSCGSSDSKCSGHALESLGRAEEKPVRSITNDFAWENVSAVPRC